MRQFSHVKNTDIVAVYSEFSYFKTADYQPENKNMSLNLRTNLLSFCFIHVPMHKGRHCRSFMKLKLYTNLSNGCLTTNFKSVGQETWSASFPSTFFAVLQGINYVMSHDYAKKTHCERHTYKRTLCLPSVAQLTFHTNNSETRQRYKEKKLSQYDSKNGGNTTIQRQRWRKKLVEFDQSATTRSQTFTGNPQNQTRRRGHRKVRGKTYCQTFEGNLWFSTKPNSEDNRCESKWHKLNTKGTKPH